MISVIKRNGRKAPFDIARLRLSIFRALGGNWDNFYTANHYSEAIKLFLERNSHSSVSSGALFEMACRTLAKAGDSGSARTMEHFRAARNIARQTTSVLHYENAITPWNRDWLDRQIVQRWDISENAARAISSEIESEIVFSRDIVHCDEIMDMADELVENFGLAPWCLMASLGSGE